ncbi:hypothetical protein GGF47_001915 [Coemansia sp. RSA 2524]|nr:hypothetical protein J3F81_004026 [Coemansia sp. RSA 371]KAJ2427070.1 hypothetical protein GGF47_001915 [Coemansia sp. RSA 2524]
MVAYPDKYPKVHGSWLRDARNIDTVAAGGRRGKTKTRSQKPKSGASGRASTEVTAEAAQRGGSSKGGSRGGGGINIGLAEQPQTRLQARVISRGIVPAKPNTDWHNLSGAVVLGERLDSGRSGIVYSGLAAGRPVAVKVADADADAEIIRELCSEVEVYQHLAELQGDDIPRLIDHGLLEVDGTLRPALVQEQIGNWAGTDYPEEDQPEMLPLSVRQSAMNTLDRLHVCGVVHGDP